MIPLPSKPKIVEKKEDNRTLFEIESLYPGYGITIGNSLRRTLLSSLDGSAVTKVRIEGVHHEFSTIEGVMEDVITIILNLKELRFRMHSDDEQVAILKVKGEKEIKGSDLELPTQVELTNPEVHIATLTDKKAELDMEISIERGMGYSSAEERKEEKLEIGQIVIDSIFTPVKRVNFYVENMRVGKRTDFDRLFIEVETDRTISPEDAFLKAVKILSEHYDRISSFRSDEEDEEKKPKKVKEKTEPKKDDVLKMPIAEMGLDLRIENKLKENGIEKIKDLTLKTKDDLTSIKGVGPKAVEDIIKKIDKVGLSLKE